MKHKLLIVTLILLSGFCFGQNRIDTTGFFTNGSKKAIISLTSSSAGSTHHLVNITNAITPCKVFNKNIEVMRIEQGGKMIITDTIATIKSLLYALGYKEEVK